MKFSIHIAVCSFVLMLGMPSCSENKESQEKLNSKDNSLDSKENLDITKNSKKLSSENSTEFFSLYAKENRESIISIETEFGQIKIQLFKDTPLHRANFLYLINKGYFNTTFFHRVSKGHVVQGGNSDSQQTAKMRGKIGMYKIENEISNHHFHKRGAVSAARSYKKNVEKDSNPFEFFISLGKVYSEAQLKIMAETYETAFNSKQVEIYTQQGGSPHLDYQHTVFGEVIEGMDVIEKINGVEVDRGEWPLNNIPIKIKILK